MKGNQNCRLSRLELTGVSWSGFGAVTILVTKSRFWPLKRELGSRNLLILLCPGRNSNPHEGNPHRILSPVRFFVGRARIKMTGPTCVWSVGEVLLRPTKTPFFNLGHSFGHSWPISGFSEQLGIWLMCWFVRSFVGCGGGI